MKKIFKFTLIMFLVSSILLYLLNYIINEQILSRLFFGVDYTTYFSNYYDEKIGLIKLISGVKMPYNWVFILSKYVIIFVCVVILFFTIKKLIKNNPISKKEFYIIMGLFSLLTLHNVLLNIVLSLSIPSIKFFIPPVIFIVSAFFSFYKTRK